MTDSQKMLIEKFGKFVEDKSILSYFTEKNGQSMSDANNIKGKCVQIAEQVQSYYDSMGVFQEKIHISDEKVLPKKSVKKYTVDFLQKIEGKDAMVNALNGWYAQSIVAKQTLLDSIKDSTYNVFLEEKESFMDEHYSSVETFNEIRPVQPKPVTESDVIQEWSSNDRANYLLLEQYCATIGKRIHKSNKKTCILHDIYNSPLTSDLIFESAGSTLRDKKDYPVERIPVYQDEELTEFKKYYIGLHDRHREKEKEVNRFKAKIKNQITEKEAELVKEYQEKLDVFNEKLTQYRKREQDYLQKAREHNDKLRNVCRERQLNFIKDASKLKIFIPEVLREVYEEVKTFKFLEV